MLRNLVLAACAWSMILAGCGAPQGPAGDENVIAPAGKEDNYFSNAAREYYVSTDVTIELDEETYADKTDAEREARARAVMEGRTKQITWFLHVYLIDKSRDDDAKDYGGLRAMVLDGAFESDGLKVDPDNPLKFVYTYKVQVGGNNDLIKLVRKDLDLAADANVFPLQLAKKSNAQVIHFSHSSYGAGDWSPDTCDCELETLQMKIESIPASRDAYLDYGAYLDDGVMDISVHFGWDYHARYDISGSRELYEWLVSRGFASPVESYQQLNRRSGPLTKTVQVNGEDVLMKISIFRPDPCESWDEDGWGGSWAEAVHEDKENKKRACDDWTWSEDEEENELANANPTTHAGASRLMEDLKQSLYTRDVIIFAGHSGYTYAYALASWYKTSAGDLDPPEIKTLPLPKDKSQLFVLSGCDTYHAAQAFRENPNKAGLNNADVITTTSFSTSGDLDDTLALIEALVGNYQGKVEAYSYGRLMSRLNPRTAVPSYRYSHFTMFGVHGIDDNPVLDPLADIEQSCNSCDSDSDCGAAGNVCVRLNADEKVCAAQCLHDDGCAEGQVCRKFGSSTSGYLRGMACVPKTLSCEVEPTSPVEQEFSAEGDVAKGEEKHFVIPVGPAARNIKVVMTGTSDADLYTRFLEAPTTSDFSCRPYKITSDETCSHDKITGDTLYLMVRGWRAASYKLHVTWE